MINDDVLIKFIRSEEWRGNFLNWPNQVRSMKKRINELKLGFPGIRDHHLSLVQMRDIKKDDIFIYDSSLLLLFREDEAPMMLRSVGGNRFYIEGIGEGFDYDRDPDRLLYRWKDTISLNFQKSIIVLRVDVRPTLNGGPGYYYFFKSYRDFRF